MINKFFTWFASLWLKTPQEEVQLPNMEPDPIQPVAPVVEAPNEPQILFWDTQKDAWHSVGVLCDNAGLSYKDKTDIRACIYQESEFENRYMSGPKIGQPVSHPNLNKDGSLSSTDWGIVQINDWFHIGIGKDFSSVDFVVANPDKAVGFMIEMSKIGQLGLWSSYKTGVYKVHLVPSSPMWLLAQ